MDVGDCDLAVCPQEEERGVLLNAQHHLWELNHKEEKKSFFCGLNSYRINAHFSPSTECWSEVLFWLGCVLKWSPLVLISWPQSQPIRCPASIPLWLLVFVMVFVSRGDWHPCFRSLMDEIWLWLPMLHFHMGKSHCNLDRGHGVHCPHMVL